MRKPIHSIRAASYLNDYQVVFIRKFIVPGDPRLHTVARRYSGKRHFDRLQRAVVNGAIRPVAQSSTQSFIFG